MYVPVTLSQPSTTNVTVDYLVVGDTASAGVDFKLGSGRLTFVVDSITGLTGVLRQIPVTVFGDVLVESNETVNVRLWNPIGGVLGSSVAKSTIINDDSGNGVRVGVGDVSIDRSSAGPSATIRAMVTLSQASLSTVSVSFRVASSTALAGVDYFAPASGTRSFLSGTLTNYVALRIPAGSATKTFGITVTLSAPVGATLSRSTGSVTVAPAPPAASVPAPSMYWGAWIGRQFTGIQAPWSMTAVRRFESRVGKHVSLIHFAAPFANCSILPCSFYKFDSLAFDNVQAYGAIPFFSWSSQSIPSSPNEPNFQLADVTAGTYDTFIKGWATAAKAWGRTFFLRFNWEMNGSWFPWSERANGNKLGDYVAAWRHVHQLFTDVGATNVSWVWCPNADPNNALAPLSSLYPGDAYVDWTCIDGYNWGGSSWQSFDRTYSSTYQQLIGTIAPLKPLIIGEVASSEAGGSKAAWLSDMLTVQLPQHYPSVRGFVWMEKGGREGDGMDWPIESSLLSQSAFANAVADGPFAENAFASRSTLPITPP
jgi:hypothetical protein